MLTPHTGTVLPLDGAAEMADNLRVTSEGADARRELDRLRLELDALRASRTRLALAADAERRDIERALHDGVQQQLVGLIGDLDRAAASLDADPAATRHIVETMRADVKQALEDMRELAQRIYPPLLDAGGLRVALRAAAAIAAIPIEADIAAGGPWPQAITATVYACCVEVLDRAEAGTSVAVTVRHEGGTLVFGIVATAEVAGELFARDRVEALGGRMTIEPAAGGRIHVTGSLPLPG